jgi:hypothetical protein
VKTDPPIEPTPLDKNRSPPVVSVSIAIEVPAFRDKAAPSVAELDPVSMTTSPADPVRLSPLEIKTVPDSVLEAPETIWIAPEAPTESLFDNDNNKIR